MKSIEIKCKHQEYKIKKANDPNNLNIIHERTLKYNISELMLDYNYQIKLINSIYLDNEILDDNLFKKYNNKKDISLNNCEDNNNQKLLIKELKYKINNYKTQDINKKIYNENTITICSLIEKLVIAKLKCHYCKNRMKLFYKTARDYNQWTLDRIDNDVEHKEDNVLISCLKCNLERRCIEKQRFELGKKLKIVKEY